MVATSFKTLRTCIAPENIIIRWHLFIFSHVETIGRQSNCTSVTMLLASLQPNIGPMVTRECNFRTLISSSMTWWLPYNASVICSWVAWNMTSFHGWTWQDVCVLTTPTASQRVAFTRVVRAFFMPEHMAMAFITIHKEATNRPIWMWCLILIRASARTIA